MLFKIVIYQKSDLNVTAFRGEIESAKAQARQLQRITNALNVEVQDNSTGEVLWSLEDDNA